MAPKNRQAISAEVYNLASSSEPISERVKEALGVIEDALNAYTCVQSGSNLVRDGDGASLFQTRQDIDQLQWRQGLCVGHLSLLPLLTPHRHRPPSSLRRRVGPQQSHGHQTNAGRLHPRSLAIYRARSFHPAVSSGI